MDNKLTGLYTIEGFDSAIKSGPGSYGFTITLAAPVVKALCGLPRDATVPLNEMILAQLRGSFKRGFGFEKARYFQNSWLLIGLSVVGDCACLGVEGSRLSNLERGDDVGIRYVPHNIDSLQQAGALLSTWLLWFNHVITGIPFEQPFAM